MAAISEASGGNPALALQSEILSRPLTENRRMADAIRALAIDAVEAAKSGHPGMPMGMADAATVLWTRFLKYDAADPRWHDRDRFVLSAGHGSMLLYALLHLTGHAGMGMAQLKAFRKLHSPAAGHPESARSPGEPPGRGSTGSPGSCPSAAGRRTRRSPGPGSGSGRRTASSCTTARPGTPAASCGSRRTGSRVRASRGCRRRSRSGRRRSNPCRPTRSRCRTRPPPRRPRGRRNGSVSSRWSSSLGSAVARRPRPRGSRCTSV